MADDFQELSERDKNARIVTILNGYKEEARNNRRSGMNPRDAKWDKNLDQYWNRYDMTKKADWQAKQVMPEVPSFVDRFAASLKEALVAAPEGWFTVVDPADEERDVADAVERMTQYWLTRTGRNAGGTPLDFSAVFEEQCKLGALMACSSVVCWKDDVPGGRVAIETVDPRNVWLDHTYRNLYRIRRIELDRHELNKMVRQVDPSGTPIFQTDEIAGLMGALIDEERANRERLTGTGQEVQSSRNPIILDEYLATVVDNDGNAMENGLFVVANDRFLLRKEKNPFWHGKDWLSYAPLVTVPLSPYGRSYMEDFGQLAETFTELTNMILDAVHTSSLRAFAVVPTMLANPGQIAGGITPNKMFLLEEGYTADDFAKALELGTLPAESLTMWNALKNELREASGINEIGMGQFAPNSRTSATEVMETKQSSSALIRSVAQTIETRYLDPQLDLVWQTGLQHAKPSDKRLAAAAGPELYAALLQNRREFIRRPYTFQARGISTLISRGQILNNLLRILQVVAASEPLLQSFLQQIDVPTLVKQLFALSNVDLKQIQPSEREKLIRAATEPLAAAQQQAQQAPAPGGGIADQMQQVAQLVGAASGA